MIENDYLRQKEEYKRTVYECLFYYEKKWPVDTATMFFWGTLVHYKDFMKATREGL